MFWIIGAASLVSALKRMSPTPLTSFLAYELGHAQWQGFHFYESNLSSFHFHRWRVAGFLAGQGSG
jgi:hypothetical protein